MRVSVISKKNLQVQHHIHHLTLLVKMYSQSGKSDVTAPYNYHRRLRWHGLWDHNECCKDEAGGAGGYSENV